MNRPLPAPPQPDRPKKSAWDAGPPHVAVSASLKTPATLAGSPASLFPEHKRHLLFGLTRFVGCKVRAVLYNNSEFEGICYTIEPSDFSVCLRQARLITPDRPNATPVIPQLSIPGKDVASISALTLDTISAQTKPSTGDSQGFKTDTAISGGTMTARERTLQKWAAPPENRSDFITLEDNKRGRWDQFATNQRLFGVDTDYNEDLYTIKLDKTAPDFKQREAEAARIAAEIEGAVSMNPHLAEERGQAIDSSGIDEEDRYSSVVRQPGKYAPPQARRGQTAAHARQAQTQPQKASGSNRFASQDVRNDPSYANAGGNRHVAHTHIHEPDSKKSSPDSGTAAASAAIPIPSTAAPKVTDVPTATAPSSVPGSSAKAAPSSETAIPHHATVDRPKARGVPPSFASILEKAATASGGAQLPPPPIEKVAESFKEFAGGEHKRCAETSNSKMESVLADLKNFGSKFKMPMFAHGEHPDATTSVPSAPVAKVAAPSAPAATAKAVTTSNGKRQTDIPSTAANSQTKPATVNPTKRTITQTAPQPTQAPVSSKVTAVSASNDAKSGLRAQQQQPQQQKQQHHQQQQSSAHAKPAATTTNIANDGTVKEKGQQKPQQRVNPEQKSSVPKPAVSTSTAPSQPIVAAAVGALARDPNSSLHPPTSSTHVDLDRSDVISIVSEAESTATSMTTASKSAFKFNVSAVEFTPFSSLSASTMLTAPKSGHDMKPYYGSKHGGKTGMTSGKPHITNHNGGAGHIGTAGIGSSGPSVTGGSGPSGTKSYQSKGSSPKLQQYGYEEPYPGMMDPQYGGAYMYPPQPYGYRPPVMAMGRPGYPPHAVAGMSIPPGTPGYMSAYPPQGFVPGPMGMPPGAVHAPQMMIPGGVRGGRMPYMPGQPIYTSAPMMPGGAVSYPPEMMGMYPQPGAGGHMGAWVPDPPAGGMMLPDGSGAPGGGAMVGPMGEMMDMSGGMMPVGMMPSAGMHPQHMYGGHMHPHAQGHAHGHGHGPGQHSPVSGTASEAPTSGSMQ